MPFMSGQFTNPITGNPSVRDFSGYGHHGDLVGFAGDDSEFVDGHLGQTALIVTAADHLEVPSPASELNFVSGPFTHEIWANLFATAGYKKLVSKYDWNVDGWLFGFNGTTLEVRSFQGGAGQATNTTLAPYADSNLHQYVATRDGSDVRLYCDGIEVTYTAKVAHINPVAADDNDFEIFESTTGYLNRLRTFSRTLGAAEIYERYIHAKRR